MHSRLSRNPYQYRFQDSKIQTRAVIFAFTRDFVGRNTEVNAVFVARTYQICKLTVVSSKPSVNHRGQHMFGVDKRVQLAHRARNLQNPKVARKLSRSPTRKQAPHKLCEWYSTKAASMLATAIPADARASRRIPGLDLWRMLL